MFQIDELFRSTVATIQGLIYSAYAAIRYTLSGRAAEIVYRIAAQRIAHRGESASSRTLLFVACFAVLLGFAGFEGLPDLLGTLQSADSKSSTGLFVGAMLLCVAIDALIIWAFGKRKATQRRRAAFRDATSISLFVVGLVELTIYIATLNRFGVESFYDREIHFDGLKTLVFLFCLLAPLYLSRALLRSAYIPRPWIRISIVAMSGLVVIFSMYSAIVAQDSELEDSRTMSDSDSPSATDIMSVTTCTVVPQKGLRIDFQATNNFHGMVRLTAADSSAPPNEVQVYDSAFPNNQRTVHIAKWSEAPGFLLSKQPYSFSGTSFDDSDPKSFAALALDSSRRWRCGLSFDVQDAADVNADGPLLFPEPVLPKETQAANSQELQKQQKALDDLITSYESDDSESDSTDKGANNHRPSEPALTQAEPLPSQTGWQIALSLVVELSVFCATVFGFFRGGATMLRWFILFVVSTYSLALFVVMWFNRGWTFWAMVAVAVPAAMLVIWTWRSDFGRGRSKVWSWFSAIHGAAFGFLTSSAAWAAVALLLALLVYTRHSGLLQVIGESPFLVAATTGVLEFF